MYLEEMAEAMRLPVDRRRLEGGRTMRWMGGGILAKASIFDSYGVPSDMPNRFDPKQIPSSPALRFQSDVVSTDSQH